MNIPLLKRRGTKNLLVGIITGLAVVGFAEHSVATSGEGRIFTNVWDVPTETTAIVLGTAPTTNGWPNPFFERRLNAARDLYRAGKIGQILVSGDHGRVDYDEVDAMKNGLLRRGVPEQRIVMDHAGFRTLDSIVRARRIFGVQKAIIITDGFHLPRSLYLAQANGIQAIGFASVPVSRSIAPWPSIREYAARILVAADVKILNRQPKFLGQQEHMPLPN